MSENKYICEKCGSEDTYFDEKYGEWICRKCGYIHRIEEEYISDGPRRAIKLIYFF
jgi:transcription initiation factor TFIIIB Brf1 subunit/transcription initiation factor TFIIB